MADSPNPRIRVAAEVARDVVWLALTGGGVAVLSRALFVGARHLSTQAALCDARAVVTDSGLRRVTWGLDPGWVTGLVIPWIGNGIGTDHPVRIDAALLRAAIDSARVNDDALVDRSGGDANVAHTRALDSAAHRIAAGRVGVIAQAVGRYALSLGAGSSDSPSVAGGSVDVSVDALPRLDRPARRYLARVGRWRTGAVARHLPVQRDD